MAHRTAANEWFGDLFQLDGRLEAGVHASALEGALQSHGVDDRRQHAHVVALGSFHTAFFGLHSAEDVSTSDHDGHLEPRIHDGFDFLRVLLQSVVVNAKLLLAHQRFTAEFEEDSFVLHGAVNIRIFIKVQT